MGLEVKKSKNKFRPDFSISGYFDYIFAYKIAKNTGGATSFESLLGLMGIHNPDEP
jgi:hypothetical protein